MRPVLRLILWSSFPFVFGCLLAGAAAFVATDFGFRAYLNYFVPTALDRHLRHTAIPAAPAPDHCSGFRNNVALAPVLRGARDSLLQRAWLEHLRAQARQAWEEKSYVSRLSHGLFGPGNAEIQETTERADRDFATVYSSYVTTFGNC